ncbi:MlaD family protein [Aestuariirhabdus sp. Z084]|uniref:PqiB family protein n=1 Tax=Aestuariirhabdus haliotis TaxID=2918751 RepID=UPI00201B3C19|nr:MlaD family protein [Aestuariirhabdus haliotis]MCL6415350.1 MlaD family protein [Aestuariirhabdus haliotis]MCL6419106.1 MlaD family protein [Aestuariirhabdus haliotis]
MTNMKPDVSTKKGISAIWIVPVLAAVLGAGMVVFSYLNQGPEVTISFSNADDLVAGKTKLKLLNVEVGQVESIALKEDLSGVEVGVRLNKQYTELLREDSRFWVERVQIGAGGIRGLGTILSGAYIQLAPGQGKAGKRSYIGLETPPQTRAGAPGVRLVLNASQAAIDVGNPVLFQGYQVGRVESRELDEVTGKIKYGIFIDAPYHNFVNTSVRFWDVSGISINASAEGFSISTGSLESIISGGIAFQSLPALGKGLPIKNNDEFWLYESQQASIELTYEHGTYFVLRFNQDISGLEENAPVKYRGVSVGRVVRIMINEFAHMDDRRHGAPIPVLVYVEPGRFGMADSLESIDFIKDEIQENIEHGFRGTLQSGNLITGSKYISLDFYHAEAPVEPETFLNYPVVPTIVVGLDSVMMSVSSFMNKLDQLPLDQTVRSANDAITELGNSMQSMDNLLRARETQEIPEQLSQTLSALRVAMQGISPDSPAYKELLASLVSLRTTLEGVSPDSPIYKDMESTLYELHKTLQNMDALTDSLKDTATMLPRPREEDRIPEARN